MSQFLAGCGFVSERTSNIWMIKQILGAGLNLPIGLSYMPRWLKVRMNLFTYVIWEVSEQ